MNDDTTDTSLSAARAYVTRVCWPAHDLAAGVGISEADLRALDAAGVVPAPTYRVGREGVESAIGRIGEAGADARGWFGPAVVVWLRRAVVAAEQVSLSRLGDALAEDLTNDLVAVLDASAADAMIHGWTDLFRDGRCDPAAARAYVTQEWPAWMAGAWAVCLRRFDGRHLVIKEVERRRISGLLETGVATAMERLSLLDAMARLDAILLPFAPHERPTGTPGQFIDEPARRFGLPWTVADSGPT
ncbi:MAG: DUF6058 family natural product biosynthesis protein [Pseudomonadota bacterium]